MKRQFWGGTSEIHQSSLNGRVDVFLNDLRSCMEMLSPSFANLSCVVDFSVDDLQSADDLRYFFSWLKKEGLENIKYIANYDAQIADVSLESVLDDCIFILEDTKGQKDVEIACENLADVIVYLSKAMRASTRSEVVPDEIVTTYREYSSGFTKRADSVRNDNNFKLTESDLNFEDEFSMAA